MITANVYNRVFFIKGEGYGTAFAIDHAGKQYLVTASHLVGRELRQILRFFLNQTWIDITAELLGVAGGEADVAVFRVDRILCPTDLPLEPNSNGICVSQEVFFVGFPYKMWTDAGNALKGRPCPFVKKGILSSAFVGDDGVPRLYVDALNNPGFSGGPIVFQPPGSKHFRVAGVVSKFRIDFESVLDHCGEDTGMTVAYNTGFLVGYDISRAIDIIERNPIGLSVI
jgi:hypothetical protein